MQPSTLANSAAREHGESSFSAVAWPAIIGGAFAAAAVSLILLLLGSGLGLSVVSPWVNHGPSPAGFTVAAASWLIIMQWLSSGLGGYLAGRLRTKWEGMHGDEVFFRDTAHGFLAWAVATLLTAALFTSAATSIIGGGAHMASVAAGQAAPGHGPEQPPHPDGGPMAYFTDSLFRSQHPNVNVPAPEANAEATRIIMTGLHNGGVPAQDKTYLAQLVSARTGLSVADADKRVDNVIGQIAEAEDKMRQGAETARKTMATVSIFMFLSLIVGAFIASVAAALGGQHRDMY